MKKTYYVVQIVSPRATGDDEFMCDYSKAPPGFARAVGIGTLQVAQVFTKENDARVAAFFQTGIVRRVKMENDRIILV